MRHTSVFLWSTHSHSLWLCKPLFPILKSLTPTSCQILTRCLCLQWSHQKGAHLSFQHHKLTSIYISWFKKRRLSLPYLRLHLLATHVSLPLCLFQNFTLSPLSLNSNPSLIHWHLTICKALFKKWYQKKKIQKQKQQTKLKQSSSLLPSSIFGPLDSQYLTALLLTPTKPWFPPHNNKLICRVLI